MDETRMHVIEVDPPRIDVRRRLYFLALAVVAALLHNVVHEAIHYLAALSFGEGVQQFRLLTNGWGTSQVVYGTPVIERSGWHWLIIAWAPAAVTTAIGYVVFVNRKRFVSQLKPLNAQLWFVGVYFLLIDPLYFAVLSIPFGGDVGAVAAVGWSPWPARAVALLILLVNLRLFVKWRREAQAQPEQYV
jgi:hypothetical protein